MTEPAWFRTAVFCGAPACGFCDSDGDGSVGPAGRAYGRLVSG